MSSLIIITLSTAFFSHADRHDAQILAHFAVGTNPVTNTSWRDFTGQVVAKVEGSPKFLEGVLQNVWSFSERIDWYFMAFRPTLQSSFQLKSFQRRHGSVWTRRIQRGASSGEYSIKVNCRKGGCSDTGGNIGYLLSPRQGETASSPTFKAKRRFEKDAGIMLLRPTTAKS